MGGGELFRQYAQFSDSLRQREAQLARKATKEEVLNRKKLKKRRLRMKWEANGEESVMEEEKVSCLYLSIHLFTLHHLSQFQHSKLVSELVITPVHTKMGQLMPLTSENSYLASLSFNV